jgi:DNA-binding LacI/PurR family transcriptional regulator
MSPKTQLPTIEDVARQAGVSIATVSRVLNSTAMVEASTAQRVRETIAALNYIPRPAARSLAGFKTGSIGLLLPEISGEFFQPLLRGIESAAREADYDLLIHSTRLTHHDPSYSRPLAEHNVDGLIIFPESVNSGDLLRLGRMNFPVVLLMQEPLEEAHFPAIQVENRLAAQELVSHLIRVHAKRRIAFLRGPAGHMDSLSREAGYRSALQAYGLEANPELVGDGAFDKQAAYHVVLDWLKTGLDFDAVFAGNDDAAIGVVSALRQAGREAAVVGFDDVPIAGYIHPALTTVSVPVEQVGRTAVKLVMDLMRGDFVPPITSLPSRLVVRESCGCPFDPQTGLEGDLPFPF